ncbi:MAG: GNAT family N-acetyltransferase [Thermomicrobiales bacterium]
MPFRLIPIDSAVMATCRDAIASVYATAFNVDTDAADHFMADALDRHRTYPGFSGLVAQDENGNVLGFTYGYHSQSGQWWHDLVRPSLAAVSRADWLDDAFEFVELAVAPGFQGQHIGSRLHDALLTSMPGVTALLSTLPGDTPATRLYRSRGWITLVPDFRYFPQGAEVLLMGLELASFTSTWAPVHE